MNIETQAIYMFFLYIVYGGIIAALGTYIYFQITGNLLPDMLNVYPTATPRPATYQPATPSYTPATYQPPSY